jgi:two-component system response regulator (stage 0 sporulation protein F)
MSEAKILIVDDENEICEITRDFLIRKNYTCFIATSEEEALELTKREQPDLVLLDVRLGSVSGMDILSKIKQLDKNTKVIMVTGLGDRETIQQAQSLGADDLITKPFTANFLSELLAEKLAK